MIKTTEIAKVVGITPRTKRFESVDGDGLPVFYPDEAERWEHVLSAVRLARTERQDVSMRVYIIAVALHKSATTGRMNFGLLRRLREQYTPYQICALIARIANIYQGEPTIGDLADFWLNRHADEL